MARNSRKLAIYYCYSFLLRLYLHIQVKKIRWNSIGWNSQTLVEIDFKRVSIYSNTYFVMIDKKFHYRSILINTFKSHEQRGTGFSDMDSQKSDASIFFNFHKNQTT